MPLVINKVGVVTFAKVFGTNNLVGTSCYSSRPSRLAGWCGGRRCVEEGPGQEVITTTTVVVQPAHLQY